MTPPYALYKDERFSSIIDEESKRLIEKYAGKKAVRMEKVTSKKAAEILEKVRTGKIKPITLGLIVDPDDIR